MKLSPALIFCVTTCSPVDTATFTPLAHITTYVNGVPAVYPFTWRGRLDLATNKLYAEQDLIFKDTD